MLRREVTSQLWMASHILFITASLLGSSMDQTSGPSNMMCESTPHALYDTSIPSALLSSRLLSRQETWNHHDRIIHTGLIDQFTYWRTIKDKGFLTWTQIWTVGWAAVVAELWLQLHFPEAPACCDAALACPGTPDVKGKLGNISDDLFPEMLSNILMP